MNGTQEVKDAGVCGVCISSYDCGVIQGVNDGGESFLVHICINVYDLIQCSTVVSFSIQQNNPDLNMCLGFLPHSTQADITSSVSICSRSGRNETCFSLSLLSTSSHTFDHYTSLLQTGKKRQEVAWQVRTSLIWCVTPRAEKPCRKNHLKLKETAEGCSRKAALWCRFHVFIDTSGNNPELVPAGTAVYVHLLRTKLRYTRA